MRPTTNKLVKAVQAEYRDNVKRITPVLDVRPEPQFADPAYRNLQFAQNTLRTCMEATLNMTLPYDQAFLVEMAIRLASYAISAAPMEDHDYMVAQVVGSFADAHMARVSKGVVIKTEWQMQDGRTMPNLEEH